MTLQSSGQISMSQIYAELGITQSNEDLNFSSVRTLLNVPNSGTTISMSNAYGKSNVVSPVYTPYDELLASKPNSLFFCFANISTASVFVEQIIDMEYFSIANDIICVDSVAFGANFAASYIDKSGNLYYVSVYGPQSVSSIPSWTVLGANFKKVKLYNGGLSLIALKNDGTLWVYGDNAYGCLGLGDTVTRTVLTQIGSSNLWTNIEVGNSTTSMPVVGATQQAGANDYNIYLLYSTAANTLYSGFSLFATGAYNDSFCIVFPYRFIYGNPIVFYCTKVNSQYYLTYNSASGILFADTLSVNYPLPYVSNATVATTTVVGRTSSIAYGLSFASTLSLNILPYGDTYYTSYNTVIVSPSSFSTNGYIGIPAIQGNFSTDLTICSISNPIVDFVFNDDYNGIGGFVDINGNVYSMPIQNSNFCFLKNSLNGTYQNYVSNGTSIRPITSLKLIDTPVQSIYQVSQNSASVLASPMSSVSTYSAPSIGFIEANGSIYSNYVPAIVNSESSPEIYAQYTGNYVPYYISDNVSFVANNVYKSVTIVAANAIPSNFNSTVNNQYTDISSFIFNQYASTGTVPYTKCYTFDSATNTYIYDPQIDNFVDLDYGFGFSVGIKNDGTMWGIGNNEYGQLGLIGNTTYIPSWTQTGNGSTYQSLLGSTNIYWTKVKCGSNHTVASLFGYPKLFATGLNQNGQIGADPSTVSYSAGFSPSLSQGGKYYDFACGSVTTFVWEYAVSSLTIGANLYGYSTNWIASTVSFNQWQGRLLDEIDVYQNVFFMNAQNYHLFYGVGYNFGNPTFNGLGLNSSEEFGVSRFVTGSFVDASQYAVPGTSYASASTFSWPSYISATSWTFANTTIGSTGSLSTSTPNPTLVKILTCNQNTVALDSFGELIIWGSASTWINPNSPYPYPISNTTNAYIPFVDFGIFGAANNIDMPISIFGVDGRDGSVWVLGDNTIGQLGLGTTSSTPTTTWAKLSNVTKVIKIVCGLNSVTPSTTQNPSPRNQVNVTFITAANTITGSN